MDAVWTTSVPNADFMGDYVANQLIITEILSKASNLKAFFPKSLHIRYSCFFKHTIFVAIQDGVDVAYIVSNSIDLRPCKSWNSK